MEETIKISSIMFDTTMQPRAELSEEIVAEYAEAMKGGATFPPVDVFHDGDSERYWLTDGWHRVDAAVKAGRDSILATIHEGTVQEAVWWSLQANKTNALHRSNRDKTKAVRGALAAKPELSDRAIADHVGVSAPFVGSVRSTVNGLQSTERQGRDGRKTNVSRIGKRPTTKTPTTTSPTVEKKIVSLAEYEAAAGTSVPIEPSPAPTLTRSKNEERLAGKLVRTILTLPMAGPTRGWSRDSITEIGAAVTRLVRWAEALRLYEQPVEVPAENHVETPVEASVEGIAQ